MERTRCAGEAPTEPAAPTPGAVTDWAWRRRIRENPASLRLYRSLVGTVGLVVVVTGLVLVPLPGPGWLIVFLGVGIWASEFHWAARLHRFGLTRLRRWNDWVMGRHVIVRAGLGVATFLFVTAAVWAGVRIMGIPGWVPDAMAAVMHDRLGL